MGVNAHQLKGNGGPSACHGPGGVAHFEPKPELGIVLAGHHELVRVGLYPWRNAQQNLRNDPVGGMETLQAIQLIEAVHHEAADACLTSSDQLAIALVVAMQHEPISGHTGREGNKELAPAGYVEMHALFVRQPGHGPAQKRFGGVGHPVAERGHGLATPRP